MEKSLPPIPAKRYFTIGEVSDLCGVKPYVLRYWEQEFTQLKPMKRRGNRRYYQHHEVLLVRRIRELLYDQGFTISGARNRLTESGVSGAAGRGADRPALIDDELDDLDDLPEPIGRPVGAHAAAGAGGVTSAALAVTSTDAVVVVPAPLPPALSGAGSSMSNAQLRTELLSISALLAEGGF